MAQPPIPGDHDLAATLRALAAKSSSFGGGANAQGGSLDPDGLNSDMLNKYKILCILVIGQHLQPRN